MGFFSRERSDETPSSEHLSDSETANINFGDDSGYSENVSTSPPNSPQKTLNSMKLKSKYGIQDAIKLMQKLSHIENDVKVVVVKTTLESMNVVIKDLILDAREKETKVSNHVETLKKEIEHLEKEISNRNNQISALEKDYAETKQVKDCLMQGEPPEPTPTPIATPENSAPVKATPPPENKPTQKKTTTATANAAKETNPHSNNSNKH